jgi:hypothetical protein
MALPPPGASFNFNTVFAAASAESSALTAEWEDSVASPDAKPFASHPAL